MFLDVLLLRNLGYVYIVATIKVAVGEDTASRIDMDICFVLRLQEINYSAHKRRCRAAQFMEQRLSLFYSISFTGHGLLDSSQSTQSEIKQKLSLTSNYSGKGKKHYHLF